MPKRKNPARFGMRTEDRREPESRYPWMSKEARRWLPRAFTAPDSPLHMIGELELFAELEGRPLQLPDVRDAVTTFVEMLKDYDLQRLGKNLIGAANECHTERERRSGHDRRAA